MQLVGNAYLESLLSMIGPTGDNLGFLLGVPRSGTTLLCAMLERHPAIACPPEPWVMLALDAFGQVSPSHPANSRLLAQAIREFAPPPAQLHAARAMSAALYDKYLGQTGKTFLIDKTPRYYLILDHIFTVYPDAKWIVLHRDPLDVAASYKASWNADIPNLLMNLSDDLPCADLALGMDRLREFESRPAVNACVVRYEELVVHPQPHLRKITDFLGLPPRDDLAEFDLEKSALRKSQMGDQNIRQTRGPHTKSIGAWQTAFTNEDLQILLDALGSELFYTLGYGETVDKLKARGIVDRGADVTREWRAKLEARLAERMALVRDPAYVPDPGAQQRERNTLQADILSLRSDAERLRAGWLEESRLAAGLLSQIQKLDTRNDNASQAESRTANSEQPSVSAAALPLNPQELLAELSRAMQLFRSESENLLNFRNSEQKQVELKEQLANARAESAELKTRLQEQVSKQQEFDQIAQHRQKLGEELAAAQLEMGELRRHLQIQTDTGASSTTDAHVDQISHSDLVKMLDEKLEHHQRAYQWLEGDRNTWAGKAQAYYAQLERIEHFKWYERVYDTAMRIGKKVVLGSPHETAAAVERSLPRITIVLPILEANQHAGDSLNAVIAQQYAHTEVIVVCGGETPELRTMMESFAPRVARVVHEHCPTICDAALRGVRLSLGDVVGVVYPGDIVEPGVLQAAAEYFFEHPAAQVVHGRTLTSRDGQIELHDSNVVDHLNLVIGKIEPPAFHLSRRNALLGVIGTDNTAEAPREWDLFNRLARAFRIHSLPVDFCTTHRPSESPEALAQARGQAMGDLSSIARARCRVRHAFSNFHARKVTGRLPRIPDVPAPSKQEAGKTSINVDHPARPNCPISFRPAERFLCSFGSDTGPRSVYFSFAGVGILTGATPAPFSPLPEALTANQIVADLGDTVQQLSGEATRVLQIGCGDGSFLQSLHNEHHWAVSGLETDFAAAKRARENGCTIWQCPVEDAPFVIEDGLMFDLIIQSTTHDSPHNYLILLRRLRGLLRPGGLLVTYRPNAHSAQFERFGEHWTHLHHPQRSILLTYPAMQRLARDCDFRIRRWHTFSNPLWTLQSLTRKRLAGGEPPPTERDALEVISASRGAMRGDAIFTLLESM